MRRSKESVTRECKMWTGIQVRLDAAAGGQSVMKVEEAADMGEGKTVQKMKRKKNPVKEEVNWSK